MKQMRRLEIDGIGSFALLTICAISFSTHQAQKVQEKEQTFLNAAKTVQAYWTTIKSNLRANLAVDKSSPVPAAYTHRMIGFLEGRLGVSVPVAWQQSFVNSKLRNFKDPMLRRGGDMSFSVFDNESWRSQFNLEFDGATRKLTKKKNDRELTVTLPPEYDHLTPTAFVVNEELGFVAFTEMLSPNAKVICMRLSNNEILWRSEMRDYVSEWYKGGPSWFAQLAVSGEDVFLFHICRQGFLVQSFGMTNGSGRPLFCSHNLDSKTKREEHE